MSEADDYQNSRMHEEGARDARPGGRERIKAAFSACPDPYVRNYLKAFGDKYLDACSGDTPNG